MMSTSFARTAGWCAVVAGVAALVYSFTFAVVVQDGDRWAQWTSTLVLAVGAAVALPVLVALYLRVRGVDEGFAMVALLVGAVAATGSLLHATFDLGVLANTPPQKWDYPSPTDPRGFATFLLTGAAIALLSTLLGRAGAPRGARAARLGDGGAAGLGVDRSPHRARPERALGRPCGRGLRFHRRPSVVRMDRMALVARSPDGWRP